MKITLLVTALLMLSLPAVAQALDKTKLDQVLDRIAEKNKGMGSLTLAKDGVVAIAIPSAIAWSMGMIRNH